MRSVKRHCSQATYVYKYIWVAWNTQYISYPFAVSTDLEVGARQYQHSQVCELSGNYLSPGQSLPDYLPSPELSMVGCRAVICFHLVIWISERTRNIYRLHIQYLCFWQPEILYYGKLFWEIVNGFISQYWTIQLNNYFSCVLFLGSENVKISSCFYFPPLG